MQMSDNNSNSYKKVENKLRDYEMIKARIDILENEIKFTELECGVSGVSYDKINTSCTNLISNLTADTALSKTEAIQYLELELSNLKHEIGKIDRALEALCEDERNILQLFYIQGREWWYVSDRVNLSIRQCQRMKNRAINRLTIALKY